MIMKKEKCSELVHHCVYMHSGILPFYDGTDDYVTRQKINHYGYHNAAIVRKENDHYVYPNVAMVAIPKRVSDINN